MLALITRVTMVDFSGEPNNHVEMMAWDDDASGFRLQALV
jgi:hypothetical protein